MAWRETCKRFRRAIVGEANTGSSRVWRAARERARNFGWQTILGAAVVALAVEILVGVVGVGILSVARGPHADPRSGALPALGPGVGLTGAWLGLVVGGIAAGRLGARGRRWRGALHGAAVWAIATVVAVRLVSSPGGFFFAQGLGVDVARPGGYPSSARTGADRVWTSVCKQARAVLAGRAPDGNLAAPKAAAAPAPARARSVGASRKRAWRRIREPLKRLVDGDVRLGGDVDRRLVVDALVGQAGLSAHEAGALVARWTAAASDTASDARDAGTTSGRRAGPLRVIALLMAGFLAASAGGWLGTRATGD